MTFHLGFFPGAKAFEAETTALITRMTAAGGTPTSARQVTINTFIKALKDNSLWTILDILYVMKINAAANARLNWKGATFNATVVGANTTFTADAGYRSTVDGSYLATGWDPSTNGVNNGGQYSQNQAGGFCQVAAVQDGSVFAETGISASGFELIPSVGSNSIVRCNSLTAPSTTTPAIANNQILWVSRESSSQVKMYYDATLKATSNASTSGALDTNDVTICGTSAAKYDGNCALFGLGKGFTQTQITNFTAAWDAYEASVAGGA